MGNRSYYIKSLAFLIIAFLTNTRINSLKYSSIDNVYKKGVNAYTGERWSECIVQFEEVLHLYKLYKAIIINCRTKCSSQVIPSDIKEDIEDLKMFETLARRRNCLIICKENGFNDVQLSSEIGDGTLYNLQNRQPYEYLHMCYFEMYALPKAASAAFTYSSANPDDTNMIKNLEYYVKQPEVDRNEVMDLEADDYAILYRLGAKSYNQGNWGETIAAMEEVLNDYFLSENSCRAECEQLPGQEWSPEFIVTITDYITVLLQCKQNCQNEVKSLGFSSGPEFISDVLSYLQISYYRVDRIKDASKATQSFLFMYPEDEDMIENKKIYATLVDKEFFTERSEVVYYYKRDNYEKDLLRQLHESDTDGNIYM